MRYISLQLYPYTQQYSTIGFFVFKIITIEADLTIIPILNKIDMPNANIQSTEDEVVELLGCKKSDILHISAKNGNGVDSIFEKIIDNISQPTCDDENSFKALIFASTISGFVANFFCKKSIEEFILRPYSQYKRPKANMLVLRDIAFVERPESFNAVATMVVISTFISW